MDITKRLIVNGSQTVNAVMINDEGEEYPVHLQALHNSTYLTLLLESGYTLTSLPYGFVKGSLKFDDIPIEHVTMSAEEEENLVMRIGAKMPLEEIKKLMVVPDIDVMEMPATNYTIQTRDELITYLETTQIASSDDDFYPLNYFVHPNALFSVTEWLDPANQKYVKMIVERRRMTVKKFRKLVAWLESLGMPKASNALDVLDAYFAWGVDGINVPIVKKERRSEIMKFRSAVQGGQQNMRHTFGLITRNEEIFPPINQRNIMWKPFEKVSDEVRLILSGDREQDTLVIELCVAEPEERTTLVTPKFDVNYTPTQLTFYNRVWDTILIQNPANNNSYLPCDYGLEKNADKLHEYGMIYAMATSIMEARRTNMKISSYDALQICGCAPDIALKYIVAKSNIYKQAKKTANGEADGSAIVVTLRDIDDYLKGNEVSQEVEDYILDCIEGAFNIDKVEQGSKLEAGASISNMVRELTTVHEVLGLDLKAMYDTIVAVQPGQKKVWFSNGDLQHSIDISPLDYKLKGYIQDITNYTVSAAKDCSYFTYITRIAREIGLDEADRHVGIEFYLVEKKLGGVKEILAYATQVYEDEVQNRVMDAIQKDELLKLKYRFACQQFFEIAFHGQIIMPDNLGGTVIKVHEDMSRTARSAIKLKCECLPAFCRFNALITEGKALRFIHYCTNAYVTPQYVIPRRNTEAGAIHETSFYSVWYADDRQNPEFFAQLVGVGAIPPNFTNWNSMGPESKFVKRSLDDLQRADSLLHYAQSSQDFLDSLESDDDFKAVPHPVEYMWPSLFKTKEPEKLATPRQTPPVIHWGYNRKIRQQDYKSKLLPSGAVKKKDTYIKKFNGFNAQAFRLIDDVSSKVPSEDLSPITVYQASGVLRLEDKNEVIDFHRITELDENVYPVKHVYDRMFLLRAMDGALWEVVV